MSLFHYLKRAVSMPPHVVLQKAFGKMKRQYQETRRRQQDLRFPTFAPQKSIPKGALFHFFRELRAEPGLLPVEILEKNTNHFLNHEFDLLGSGWTQVAHGLSCGGVEGHKYEMGFPISADSEGRWLKGLVNEANLTESRRLWGLIEQNYTPIDWQLDFKSGFRWDTKTWSPEIRYGHQPGADVKVPWELARMQHLPQMALAHGLSKDDSDHDALRREFRNQILDFMASNPPRFGVNWVCAMDVAIRVANWLVAYDYFKIFEVEWDEPFEEAFTRSIYEHAFHIFHHLEWDPVFRSNHYLADIVGLLFASAHLSRSATSDNWLQFSARELVKEVDGQFHVDGSNFEASTSYHRLSAEMAVYGTALLLGLPPDKRKVLGTEQEFFFSESYRQRLEKMAEFTMDITKPDGWVVQVGDNDSGRFFKFLPDSEGILDHRNQVAATNGLTSREDFQTFAQGKEWETKVVEALAGGAKLPESLKPRAEEKQRSYPGFGLYVWKKGPWYLCVRCGPVGQKGNGGHAHNDQLSFELSVKGVSLIVDSGSYVYTPSPEERNRFRSTAMHNTLALEGMEQNTWMPGSAGLFQMRDNSKAKVVQFDNKSFVGEHEGFGVTTRRTLNLKEGRLEGIDECPHPGEKAVYFHLAPGCHVQLYPPVEALVQSGSASARLSTKDGRLELEESFYSEAYGVKEKASVLVLKSSLKAIGWKIQILDS